MNRLTPRKMPVPTTRRRGYTLVEMLAAMGALVMVFGVLGAVLVQGLDSAARTRAKHRAAASASMGIANAMNDIADSAAVTGWTIVEEDGVSWVRGVRYRRPVVGPDGKYILVPRNETPGPFTYVAPGDEVEVFFDPASGTLYRQLTRRANLAYVDGMPVSLTLTTLDPPEIEVVAEGLADAHFTVHWDDPDDPEVLPDPMEVNAVTIHLTSEGADGNRTASDTTQRTAKLRNHL